MGPARLLEHAGARERHRQDFGDESLAFWRFRFAPSVLPAHRQSMGCVYGQC